MADIEECAKEFGQPARSTNDFVGPEGLRRRELDRPFKLINDAYAQTYNRAASPLAVARKIALASGSVAILDVGCGTGRTLFDFVTAVREANACPPEMVRGVGVSLHDYSGESTDPAVDAAIAAGDIEYRVGPAEQMRRGDSSTYDIVLSHEMMTHVRKHRQALEQMRAAAGRDGYMYVNTPSRRGQPAPRVVAETFAQWQGYGHQVLSQSSATLHMPTQTLQSEAVFTIVLPLDRQ
jgi:2-polyprenyl-3-methyl-5-hydroxy-6-metoxy-1,4-benzoquinol methylase